MSNEAASARAIFQSIRADVQRMIDQALRKPTGAQPGGPHSRFTIGLDGQITWAEGLSGAIVWETAGGISIPNNTNTALTLDPTNAGFTSYYIDTSAYWAGGHAARLVFPADGYYSITGHIAWDANATGMCLAALNHLDSGGTNIAGLTTTQMSSFSSFGGPHQDVVYPVLHATAGQGVELTARQNSGAGRSTTGNSYLSVIRIS